MKNLKMVWYLLTPYDRANISILAIFLGGVIAGIGIIKVFSSLWWGLLIVVGYLIGEFSTQLLNKAIDDITGRDRELEEAISEFLGKKK